MSGPGGGTRDDSDLGEALPRPRVAGAALIRIGHLGELERDRAALIPLPEEAHGPIGLQRGEADGPAGTPRGTAAARRARSARLLGPGISVRIWMTPAMVASTAEDVKGGAERYFLAWETGCRIGPEEIA